MTSLYVSEIEGFFQIRNAMSRNYFLTQLMPIWRGFLAVRAATSAAASVRFEHKDSLGWQRFRPTARTGF